MSVAVQIHAAPDTLPVRQEQAAAPSKAAAAAVRAGTGKSTNTIRAYTSAWKGFCTWAEANGHDPLPASLDTVALYIEARTLAGKSAGALRLDQALIKAAHKEARRAALAAIETTARRPREREHPEQAEYRGNQDIALVRVMRDGLLRREEASRLTWGDIYTRKDGYPPRSRYRAAKRKTGLSRGH